MKKYFVLFGSVLLMFLLACGKPDEATQAVIDQIGKISEIETITLDNSSLINSALDNYNNLTDSQKKKVNNYNELKTAEEKINVLQEQLAKEYGKKIKDVLKDMNKTSKKCDSLFEKNIEIWGYGISYVEDVYTNDGTWSITKQSVTLMKGSGLADKIDSSRSDLKDILSESIDITKKELDLISIPDSMSEEEKYYEDCCDSFEELYNFCLYPEGNLDDYKKKTQELVKDFNSKYDKANEVFGKY